jgi:hypothetical protein
MRACEQQSYPPLMAATTVCLSTTSHLDHCGALPYFTEMCGYVYPRPVLALVGAAAHSARTYPSPPLSHATATMDPSI